jgi:hypothetical protein
MKLSSLPANIQTQVKAAWFEGKKASANDRMRYFVTNGYATADDYRRAVLEESPTVEEMKFAVLDVMKSRFVKHGFEDWMNQIPNAAMICRNHNELVMMTKAGK